MAGLGAVALLVSLFLGWFETGFFARPVEDPRAMGGIDPVDAVELFLPAASSGWSSLGWLALVPLVVAIALGLALVLATLLERDSAAIPVAVGVFTVPWAMLAVVAILVRLVAQPGPNAETSVRWPAWLGLAAALAILVGAWRALADERTGSAHARAQTERALSVRGTPRPVPPPPDEPS